MPPTVNQPANRREFLRVSARYGWFVALGGALAWLATRNRPAAACSGFSPCISCPSLHSCGLPPALDFKTNQEPAGDSATNSGAQP